MIDIARIPVVTFTDPATIRLISTAYIDEPALAPLTDDADELAFLEGIEALTSTRQDNLVPLPQGLSRDELLTEASGYGWTLINAAFCYTRAEGNRFNTAARGAWYAAHGDEAVTTAQQEVAWHLSRELRNTGVFDNVTQYRELVAGFTTGFHDLRGFADAAFLDPDIGIGHRAGQEVSKALFAAGSNGVLYPSQRHRGGQCLAAFRPGIVQNLRQGATWTFTWAGDATPLIVPATRSR